jgi:pimeloyl-ACP methyl ester carboxylesterase
VPSKGEFALSVLRQQGMSTFVLVHTAWNGTHCFRKVRPLLRAAGHDVVTPGLTGIGARIHLASPQVGLTTHIQDLVNEVLYEDLTDVVLLGYSYGGMVATGSLDYIADRVTHLVYLDAFVPADGESVGDVISRTGGPVLSGEAPPLVGPGSTWLLPPPPARAYDDADDAAWMAARGGGGGGGSRRNRVAVSRSLFTCVSRSSSSPLRGPISRRRRNPDQRVGDLSGSPVTTLSRRQHGATTRSTRIT